jgi:phage tail-like protein
MISGGSAVVPSARRALGIRFDPYPAFNFYVEIEGIITAGFTDVSGLAVETQLERKMFGGENDLEYAFITGTRYSDLTLKWGLIDLDMLWNWHQDVVRGKIKRRNGVVVLMDQAGQPGVWWEFYEACPIKWEGPTFNAMNGNAVATESLVLNHRGLSKPMAAQLLATSSAAAVLVD